ncbi:WD40 repeat domain 95 [Cricetulus griseus]
MSVWYPCSILKPAAILGEPVMLQAQTSPTRPQTSGKPRLQSVEPPDWLLRACLTRERMRSHSVSTLRKTPLHHADLAHSLRAEKSIGQIEQLFMKIDYEAVGRIQWDSLCTYLQLEYSEQAKAEARQAEAALLLPAGKSTSRKSQWVTDIVSMPQYNKLIVGTGSRKLQLYELSNLEPYCQISGLKAVPLKLDYCSMEHDKCLILYGDDQLNYYDSMKAVISSSNHEPTALVIGFTVGATDVKEKLKEIRNVGKTVKMGKSSASLALPQRRAECGHTVFCIHKGVKTFSFCRTKNLLVTGGVDRIVRVWNPYLPGKPTGVLRGHMAPVVYVHISSEENKVFSVSADNTVKNHGHKEDILCVAQCPPFLLATSSYDGEIIVWNVISGHVYCKLNPSSPVDGQDHREGSVTFWKLFSGAGLIANFIPSSLDKPLLSFHLASLQLIEGDDILLSSSLDCTVSLWSKDGAYIGTFGQNHPWDVFTPASWSHPRVPFEILTDPQSMPTHLVLETDAPAGCSGGQPEQDNVTEKKVLFETEKTPHLPSPEGPIVEADVKEDGESQWSTFCHGRLLPARRKPRWKAPELKWPSIYQALQCHEITCVSALWEKPDLSVIGSDMFNISLCSQERAAELLGRKELSPWSSFLPEC